MAARIDHAVTSGTFSLDGHTWPVENNVWVVGDDSECVVIDAPHAADPIAELIGGRRLVGILCTHAHDDHVTVANELADQDEPVRRLLTGLFGAWVELIAITLRQAEAAGEAQLAMPAEMLAGTIVSLWEGSITRSRASNSLEPLDQFFALVFERLLGPIDPQES